MKINIQRIFLTSLLILPVSLNSLAWSAPTITNTLSTEVFCSLGPDLPKNNNCPGQSNIPIKPLQTVTFNTCPNTTNKRWNISCTGKAINGASQTTIGWHGKIPPSLFVYQGPAGKGSKKDAVYIGLHTHQ